MIYFFNELSLNGLPAQNGALDNFIRPFVKQTIFLKKIGYRELRSYIYLFDIQFPNGQLLANWVKDRNSGDIEIKRRFKSISLKAPLFIESDPIYPQFQWSLFKHNNIHGQGLGAAYLSNSIVISFNCDFCWSSSKIKPVIFEKIQHDTIVKTEVEILNVSKYTHIIEQKVGIYSKLVEQFNKEDFNPTEELLPNLAFTNDFLKITRFYKRFQKLSRTDKTTEARKMGRQVALLNNYYFEEQLSKINSTASKIRDIYISQNAFGKKFYLSVDIEKGGFEVCDFQGEHQHEILFNGIKNSRQKLDHNIKFKK